MDPQSLGYGLRSLLISKYHPKMLVVSRGADTNYDPQAEDVTSGRGQVRVFDTTTVGSGADFTSSGTLLGWGMRNPLALSESPIYGGIYTGDVGIDGVTRNGVDIHIDNPGDEFNFHGFVGDASGFNQGGNYGYPQCNAVFDPSSIPDAGTLQIGDQFAAESTGTASDAYCAADFVPPRLTFQAHMTPTDIKFYPSGRWAFVAFHGSIG
jgi:glucose/arabinose dehydrogenase